MNKYRLLNNIALGFLFVITFTLVGSFTHKAAAINNTIIGPTAPLDGSANVTGGAATQPWFAVGTGEFDGAISYAKVYVNNNTTAHLSVQQASCSIDIGTPGVTYKVWNLGSSEGFGTASPALPVVYKAGTHNCTDPNPQFTLVATNSNSSAQIGHQGYNVFLLLAQIDPDPSGADNEHSFRLSVDGANNLVGVSAPVIASGTRPWFGIYQRDSPGNANWDYAVQFAPNCTQDLTPNPEYVDVYDIDYGVYPQPTLHSEIQRDARGGSFSWGTAPDGLYSPPGATLPSGNPSFAHRDANDPNQLYQFVSGNHSRNDLSFRGDTGYRNRILFRDVNWRNTIQVTLPFDQFNATLTPAICNPPPPPPPPPVTDGKCNIVTQPVRTQPGAAVNFAVRITNLGTTTLASPAIKLYIVGPSGVTGSFDIPTTPGATAQDMTVSIINVPSPPTTTTYPAYRTYRLGYSQSNTFGGSCSVDLKVEGSVMNGLLTAASCTGITGQVWLNETDNTPTYGRLHITAPGIDMHTSQFITWNTPHGSGGKWFYINPYNYDPASAPGPTIDVLMHYRDRYLIQLEVQDGSGGWDPAGSPANLEYPCLTGTMTPSCTNVAGTLYFKSLSTTNITGQIHSVSPTGSNYGRTFQAHYGYGTSSDLSGVLDPFNAADMGMQNLPHTGANFDLNFYDTDSTGPWAVPTNDGSAQVANSIGPCLDWGGCSPNPVTFEVNTTTTQTFAMGYVNRTRDSFPGYYGVMNSDGTVRIAQGGPAGTGPIKSSLPGVVTNGAPPYPGNISWPGVVVSSTGSPYDGFIYLVATYGGTPINVTGSNCAISVYQVTKPYFKAFGASVSTGGAFNKLTSPIDTTCTGGNTPGGVKAFAHFKPFTTDTIANYSTVPANQKYGASVEYSIESLGTIDGTNTSGLGFYSGDTHDAAKDYINTLDLGDQTNSPTTTWGGNLGSSHCIENYYSKHTGGEIVWNGTDNVPTMFGSAAGTAIKAQAYQKDLGGPGHTINLDGGNTALPRNTRVTLFVNGDVYIHNNIIYDTATKYDPSDPTTVPPYFALIATGSIYVDPGVTELDGLYVAQSGDGFSTCGDPTTQDSNMPKAQIGANCISKLTVNGAVVAYQLKLLRIGNTSNATNTLNNAGGDNGSSLLSNPAVCATAQPPCPRNNNAVEEFNYTPSMVENQPYYLCTATCGNLGTTEKTFNLPPVY